MKTKQIMRITIGVFCCLVLLNIIPIVNAQTDHFTNSVILIIGKCNIVATPTLWLFGFKFLISKKVIIQANSEEGEKINALVLPPQIGFYFDINQIITLWYTIQKMKLYILIMKKYGDF